jgi:hypothetical protein
MALVPDDPGDEAVLEEVAPPLVPAVEAAGVRAVQALHAAGDPWLRRLDDHMVVRVHQADDMTDPGKALDRRCEQVEEVGTV